MYTCFVPTSYETSVLTGTSIPLILISENPG